MGRWTKGLGAGCQGRIIAVLRTYMMALISKAVLSRDDRDRLEDETCKKVPLRRIKEWAGVS